MKTFPPRPTGLTRRLLFSSFALLPSLIGALRSTPAFSQTQSDGLPSWNEGPTKKAIVDFVARVTKKAGPTSCRPTERIATFDNDGTLWVEQPMYVQIAFALDRVKALAPQHPEWKTKQPFKAVLDRRHEGARRAGEKGSARNDRGDARRDDDRRVREDRRPTGSRRRAHPRFKRPYTELVYQPMLELLAYLRANGFKTYIVSGGGVEFMRPWTRAGLRHPAGAGDRPLASRRSSRCATASRCCCVCRRSTSSTTRPGKPVGIDELIGRRPIAAFGNSDGDCRCCNGRRCAAAARASA